MKDTNKKLKTMRIEDFSIVEKVCLNYSSIPNYYLAYYSDGRCAVYDREKKQILYNEFDCEGSLEFVRISTADSIVGNFNNHGLLPLCWKKPHYSTDMYALYSTETKSYIAPFGEYTVFKFFYSHFVIGDGFTFYFINLTDFTIEKICLKIKSEVITLENNIVIFKQEDSPEYVSAYSLKEKKFILPFEYRFNMITIHETFGLIVKKHKEMAIYSYSGKRTMDFSDNIIEPFEYGKMKYCLSYHEFKKLDILKKITIKNGIPYTGVYTFDNTCIAPKLFKNVIIFFDELIVTEGYDLSYEVYSIKKRKAIVPSANGILANYYDKAIKAVKSIRFGGHEAYYQTRDVPVPGCRIEKIRELVDAEYKYTICYDLYSFNGELLGSNIIEEISKDTIWNPIIF